MKIYVNDLYDGQGKFNGLLSPALESLGFVVTHNIDDDFDDALMLCTEDSVTISNNLRNRNLPTIKYDICDKWLSYELLKSNEFPVIPTCLPRSEQDIIDFCSQYGSFVVKPRIGSGTGGTYLIHYHTYDSAQELIDDLSSIPGFWEIQTKDTNSEVETLKIQIILQKLIVDSDNNTWVKRIKGEINDKGEYTYYVNPLNKKTRNVFSLKEKYKDLTTQPKNTMVYGKFFFDTQREPTDTTYRDNLCDSIVEQFRDIFGLKSTWFQFEGVEDNGIYYINDITFQPHAYYTTYTPVDGVDYFGDHFAWQYGLKSEIEHKIYPAIFMGSIFFDKPSGGITREKLANIETNNIKKTYTVYTGQKFVSFIFRGNSVQEIVDDRNKVFDYLNTL